MTADGRADFIVPIEAADAAMSSDPTYLERIDQGGELFLPGAATQRLIRRLAYPSEAGLLHGTESPEVKTLDDSVTR